MGSTGVEQEHLPPRNIRYRINIGSIPQSSSSSPSSPWPPPVLPPPRPRPPPRPLGAHSAHITIKKTSTAIVFIILWIRLLTWWLDRRRLPWVFCWHCPEESENIYAVRKFEGVGRFSCYSLLLKWNKRNKRKRKLFCGWWFTLSRSLKTHPLRLLFTLEASAG